LHTTAVGLELIVDNWASSNLHASHHKAAAC
jgi:hypothetical protein